MSSVIHIAEIAALLTIAYVIGWAIGYVVHRLVARPAKPAAAAIPAERLAAATGAASDALVKAPVIVPVVNDPPPAPPQPAAPSVVEPAVAGTAPVLEPLPPTVEPIAEVVEDRSTAEQHGPTARVLPPVVIPSVVTPPDLFTRVEPPAPIAVSIPEPASVAPAAEPEQVAVAEYAASAAPAPAEPEPQPTMAPELLVAAPVAAGPVALPEPAPAPKPVPAPFTATPALRPGIAWSGEIKGRASSPFEPPVPAATEPAPSLVPEPEPVAEPAAIIVPPPPPVYDEDAAMRAIEGGWSRTRARAMPNAPELHDVGAAVAAATAAVEQVLANAGIEAPAPSHTKPLGLVRPRLGGKDDLKQINGLGGLDESTLNNLGVYHFDQIAAWSDAEVLWMENHVFARGRIGHENWQAQARQLALTVGS